MNDWDDFYSIEDVCSYCNATFRGDMLRDHIILEHCHESEKENNYKVILAEHSLKSLYHVQEEEEVQTERQLRSRKVEGVVGSKRAKKRTLKDWSQQHQSLLIKMNESIIDEDKDEPSSSKRRSIGDESQQIEIQGNILSDINNESVSNPVATPEPITEKIVEKSKKENTKNVATAVRRSQRNCKL